MGGLFGAKTNAAAAPRYTQMQLQSSVYGVGVPIIYGTTRAGWNLGDYQDFAQHNDSSSGGKGGIIGGGGKGSQTVSYSASVIGFICEGPITGCASTWSSQTQSAGTPGFTMFDGAVAQAPWSYFSSAHPTHALSYSGVAYAAVQNYDLGTSANLPNINWEVQGIFQGTAPGTYGGNGCVTGGDADPSLVIPDLLTNAKYGLGFPAGRIGDIVSNNETHTIPSSGARTITPTNAAGFSYNINVVDTSGNLYTCVSGAPGTGQYAFNQATGVYTFSSANSGTSVEIRYASLTTLANFQAASIAQGLWISPAYTDQTAASSMLDDIATACFADYVWSSGILTVVPRVSVAVSGNGYSYTPPSSPLFSLTADDFMPCTNPIGALASSNTDDAVIVSRSRASDQINDVKIEAFDRANQYAPTVVERTAQGLIDAYGRRPGATQSLHMFCDINAAGVSAELQLQDEYIRNTYSFQLDERFAMLDPMDIVELTDSNYPGLTNIPVRILEIQENDDGSLSFSAEEYPGAIGTQAVMVIDAGQGTIQDFNVDPGNCAAPAIFDVPVQLAETLGLESWIATHSATGNLNWGGCQIWISGDNTTYAYTGQILGPSRMGTLTANFPSGSDPDTTDTLSVDLTQSTGQLQGGTTADADAGDTICFVDGEYVSYSTAALTATYKYNLTSYLRRGQWGSAISAHSSGTLFVRLDDGVFKIPYAKTDVGRTIYVKLLSFNIYGGGLQDISSVGAYSHTIDGPPTIYAPISPAVQATIKGNLLTWTNAPNVGVAAIEIWRSASSSFGGATHIGDAGPADTSYIDNISVSSNTQYWYWIRCRDIAGNEGTFAPSSSGAGVTATTGQAQTADIGTGQVITPTIATNAVTNSLAVNGTGTTNATIVTSGGNVLVIVSGYITGASGSGGRVQVSNLTSGGFATGYNYGGSPASTPFTLVGFDTLLTAGTNQYSVGVSGSGPGSISFATVYLVELKR